MFFGILFLLLNLATPTFVFNGRNIDIEIISSAPVVNYGTKPNTCGILQAFNNQAYHASTENVYQNAFKGSLDSYTTVLNISNVPTKILEFGISTK